MTESLIAEDNLLEKNVENSAFKVANSNLERIGNFVQGGDQNFSDNNIDALNDTLVFNITNPTSKKLNVNLFGFTNSLFSPSVNPPPSILSPVVPTGATPTQAAFCPVNNFIYTSNFAASSITVIDCATNTVVTTVFLGGGGPSSITYCPVNNQMYVGYSGLAQITRIDCATNAIVGGPIFTSGFVAQSGMAYNSVSNTIYALIPGAILVDVINCTTNLVATTFAPAAVLLSRIAYNPALNRMYISDFATSNIFVINCVTNGTVATIPTVLVGASGLVFCPVNNFIYVVGFTSNNVLPISTITNVPGVVIPIGIAGPRSIVYNFINNLLYVPKATTNDFIIINPVTNAIVGGSALGGVTPRNAVYNGNDNTVWFVFSTSSNVQQFFPISAPSIVTTISGGYTLGDLYNDLQGKPLWLVGMKMIVQTLTQFFNNIIINYYTIYGKQDSVQFQPTNYISPTNAQALIIDAADLGIEVDGNTDVLLDVEPQSSLVILFTINRAVDNIVPLFKDITKDWGAGTDETTNVRKTGNPLADMVLIQDAEKILSESGYNSVAQYAFYPRETGNPVVDAVLLNDAGLENDH